MKNPLFKLMVRAASSERIDMQEDYLWIRKAQTLLSKIKATDANYDFLDDQIYSDYDQQKIPIRIFYPEKMKHDEYILYIHGGGWAIGDIDTYSQACANLANELGRIVYSIDYRLAPEHPYPAGLLDCYSAVKKLIKPRKDKKREWILMGDSAGGNLAASLLLLLKEDNRSLPENLILMYPLTYWDHTDASPFSSVHKYGKDYGLTSKKMQEYMEMYEPDLEQRKIPTISPLMATDLSGFPRTLIITAEYDLLRDEGEAFGKLLQKNNNEVYIHRIKDSIHGFITYDRDAEPLQKSYKIIRDFLN